MKKIIQISVSEDGFYCLTEEGKVYRRENEYGEKDVMGRKFSQVTKTYWEEIPEELNY